MQNLTDEEILHRVQRGERGYYVALYDRYYSRVEAYARRQLHNADSAADIASETFLRAYNSVDRFRTGEAITYLGYLLMICHRLILRERARWRTARTESVGENTDRIERFPDPAPLPLAALLRAERYTRLQAALQSLPALDREIITLAFEHDLSRRDIMEILDKPSIGAVTSHLYRAMQKLKGILEKQGYFTAA